MYSNLNPSNIECWSSGRADHVERDVSFFNRHFPYDLRPAPPLGLQATSVTPPGEDSITGTLNIKAEGVVANTVGYIGRESDSTGVATITGSGSQWNNSSDLYVGNYGTGTLNIEVGGAISNNYQSLPSRRRITEIGTQ